MKAGLESRLRKLEACEPSVNFVLHWSDDLTPKEEARIAAEGGWVIQLRWLDEGN